MCMSEFNLQNHSLKKKKRIQTYYPQENKRFEMIGRFTLAFSQYQEFQFNVSKGNTTALFGKSAKTKSIEKQGRGFGFSP